MSRTTFNDLLNAGAAQYEVYEAVINNKALLLSRFNTQLHIIEEKLSYDKALLLRLNFILSQNNRSEAGSPEFSCSFLCGCKCCVYCNNNREPSGNAQTGACLVECCADNLTKNCCGAIFIFRSFMDSNEIHRVGH